ncbi:carboxymuconolactone decarboxylase family protein [Oricola indica]|uniref:carboxymuconolactone decarboxylase family protein n=1 Tax=Oricola indica TaxID=2872591 RepID=UPI003CCB7710
MAKALPGAAGDLAEQHPDIWAAYSALGKAASDSGPLNERERRLVKLALAIGANSEGAVHSHARRAKSEGIEKPRSVRSRCWQ